MTLVELIEEAAKLGGWMLTPEGAIRRRQKYLWECPITAVANTRMTEMYPIDVGYWWLAAELLNLPLGLADSIVRAVDNVQNTREQEVIREEMLKRLKVKKVGG
jgi:hypothetical protein